MVFFSENLRKNDLNWIQIFFSSNLKISCCSERSEHKRSKQQIDPFKNAIITCTDVETNPNYNSTTRLWCRDWILRKVHLIHLIIHKIIHWIVHSFKWQGDRWIPVWWWGWIYRKAETSQRQWCWEAIKTRLSKNKTFTQSSINSFNRSFIYWYQFPRLHWFIC